MAADGGWQIADNKMRMKKKKNILYDFYKKKEKEITSK